MCFKRTMIVGTMMAAGMARVATAEVGVGVDVSIPNVRVQVGTHAPPPPVVVVERERVVVREKGHHDRGRHKGHYKKQNKRHKHD